MKTSRADLLGSGLVALVIGFLLLIAITGSTIWFIRAEQRTRDMTQRALDIEARVTELLAVLQDAVIGQREYMLTGDEASLAPYDRATDVLPRSFQTLRAMLADDPRESAALNALYGLATDELAALRSTTLQRRASRWTDALAMVRAGTAEAILARIRQTVGDMMAELDRQIVQRHRQAARTSAWLQRSIAAAVVLLVALTAITVWSALRQMRRVVDSRDALREVNEHLTREMLRRETVEEQLRQSQKMEALGQLTGGLAHDFNNVLAVIVSSLNLLQRRVRDQEEPARFIRTAMEAADRAATLTRRLLAFARRQPLAPQAIDVNRFVAGVSDLLRRTLGEAVRLETLPADVPWYTNADPSQLENALLNLAINSRDAMPGGGQLTIAASNVHLAETSAAPTDAAPGDYVRITVTDNGTGMPPEVIAKAFDPFFTTKAPGKGTGLGLSQVYGFVKQSGGHVGISSTVGRGTTVSLYLPRLVTGIPPATAPVAVETEPPPTAAARETILVVEDDASVRQMNVESLQELGYRVLQADSAAAALRLVETQPGIAVLFTDIVLPDSDGRDLARDVRQRLPGIRVLFATGYTREAIRANGVLEPDQQVISKPYTLAQLATRLRAVLDSPLAQPDPRPVEGPVA